MAQLQKGSASVESVCPKQPRARGPRVSRAVLLHVQKLILGRSSCPPRGGGSGLAVAGIAVLLFSNLLGDLGVIFGIGGLIMAIGGALVYEFGRK